MVNVLGFAVKKHLVFVSNVVFCVSNNLHTFAHIFDVGDNEHIQ